MIDTNKPLDVWLKFDHILDDCDDDTASHEANTFQNDDGTYRVEWYLTAVGLVTTVNFDTYKDAQEWLTLEGFSDYSA